MKNNIIALYAGGVPAVREADDPDLYVNFVARHPGHIQRRKDRKDAARRRAVKARDERDQQMRDLTMVSQFTTLGVVVVLGLML